MGEQGDVAALAPVRDRPGAVTAAAVLVMVQAALVGIAGLVLVLVVAVIDTLNDDANHVHHGHGYVWLFGIPLFAAGAFTVFVATRLLAGRPWARALTFAVDGLLGALTAVGAASSSDAATALVSFALLVAPIVLLLLPDSRRWFAVR